MLFTIYVFSEQQRLSLGCDWRSFRRAQVHFLSDMGDMQLCLLCLRLLLHLFLRSRLSLALPPI